MLDKARVYYEARTTYYSAVLIVNVIAMAALTSLAMNHLGLFLIGLIAYSLGLRSVLVTELMAASSSSRELRARLQQTAVLWFSLIYTVVLTALMLMLQTN